MEQKKIRFYNRLAYAVGDFYGGGGFFIVSTFTMFFLINVAGLSPLAAGLVIGLGKVWDAISDPLMGYITDKTHSRFGRRRIYFLIGIIPIFISSMLIWLPVNFSVEYYKFIYYFLAYIFFYTVSTFVMVPYSALGAEMTTDFKERNRIFGLRMIFSMASTLIVGLFAQPIIDMYATPAEGHKMLGIFSGLFCAIPFIFVFLGTWELPYERNKSEYKNFFRNFITIFNNRSFRIHIGMYIFAYAAMDVLMSWLKFYMNDYLERPKFLSIGLGAIIITQILSISLYIYLANKKGKGFAYILGMTIWGIAMLLFSFQTAQSSTALLIINCILIGFGLSAAVYVPWAILPFVTDVDELITGEKRAGTYSGAMTLTRKMIQGLIVLPLLGLMLNIIDYKPNAIQSADTIISMKYMFIFTPILFIIIGIYFATRFKINPKTHKIMMDEIERLKSGGSKLDVNIDTKNVCQALTGISYEKLYTKDS